MTPRTIGCRIIGCGAYLPERVMTNDDMAKIVDTSDAWIRERSGIQRRHIAADDQLTSDLAVQAGKNAITDAGMTAQDIDLVMVATTTPDRTFPATSARVQHLLGIPDGGAFDLQAVCSGFLYGLHVADALISSGRARHILLIGAETLSRILDWNDRSTCILFGDGAGAVVLAPAKDNPAKDNSSDTGRNGTDHSDTGYSGTGYSDTDPSSMKTQDMDIGDMDIGDMNIQGILATRIHCDGSAQGSLYADGGPSLNGTAGYVRMNGSAIFRRAVDCMAGVSFEVLKDAQIPIEQIDWIVPHQANARIMRSLAAKMKVDKDKIVQTIADHANTSAASIPLALATYKKSGKLKDGQMVLAQSVGGGLTWAAALIRW